MTAKTAKIEYKGKTVEEAIQNACAKLNVNQDELDIEVLSTGSTGIFGLGRKKASIRVQKKKSILQQHLDETNEALSTIMGPDISKPMQKKRNRKPLKSSSPKALDKIINKAEESLSRSPSEEMLNEIKNQLSSLLELMGHQLEVEIESRNNKVYGHIKGDQLEAVTGEDGNVLDALQYLMRKILSQKFNDKIIFSLDAGDFRDRRKKELENLAIEMAKKVKATGKSKTIGALNPAERRIIHVALQADSEIRSTSLGEGLFKKIKIFAPGRGKKRPYRRPRGKGKPPQQQQQNKPPATSTQ